MPGGVKVGEEADRIRIEAGGLRLTFRHADERWDHAFALGEGFGGAASSVEGGDATRVISPAYQEIQRHASDQGVVFLLTGQAGPHHYSAVVKARCDGGAFVVEFDVADRCRAPVEVLAATYLVRLGSSDLVEAGPDRVVWGGPELGHGRLEFAGGEAESIALAEAGRCATRVQSLARIVPSTHTQRLYYRWRWTPPDPQRPPTNPPPAGAAGDVSFARPS
jgi:hypothetical protein